MGLLDSVLLPPAGTALGSVLAAANAVLPTANLAPLPVIVAEEAGYRWHGGRGLWIALSPRSERDALREVERRAGGAGRQWARDDFAPVAAELDLALAPLAAAA